MVLVAAAVATSCSRKLPAAAASLERSAWYTSMPSPKGSFFLVIMQFNTGALFLSKLNSPQPAPSTPWLDTFTCSTEIHSLRTSRLPPDQAWVMLAVMVQRNKTVRLNKPSGRTSCYQKFSGPLQDLPKSYLYYKSFGLWSYWVKPGV